MPFPYTRQHIETIKQPDGYTYYFLDTETLSTSRNRAFVGSEEAKESGLVAEEFRVNGDLTEEMASAGLYNLVKDFYRGSTFDGVRYNSNMAPESWEVMSEEDKIEHIKVILEDSGFNGVQLQRLEKFYSQQPGQSTLHPFFFELMEKYSASDHIAMVISGSAETSFFPILKRNSPEVAIVVTREMFTTQFPGMNDEKIEIPARTECEFYTGPDGIYLHAIKTDNRFVREIIMGSIDKDDFTENYQYYVLNHQKFAENERELASLVSRQSDTTPLSAQKKQILDILKELHDLGFAPNQKTFGLWMAECRDAGIENPMTTLKRHQSKYFWQSDEATSITKLKKLFGNEIIEEQLEQERNAGSDLSDRSLRSL